MHLSPDKAKRLAQAIADALPRDDDIRQLAEYLGAARQIETGTYDDMLSQIIGWVASRDKVRDLVLSASEMNSDNVMLRQISEDLCSFATTVSIAASPVRAELKVLSSMAEMPVVSKILFHSRGPLEEARRRLQQVRLYKGVHDILHDIQEECFEQLELELRAFCEDFVGRRHSDEFDQIESTVRSRLGH